MEMVNQDSFKANPPDTKVSAGKTNPVGSEFRANPNFHLPIFVFSGLRELSP